MITSRKGKGTDNGTIFFLRKSWKIYRFALLSKKNGKIKLENGVQYDKYALLQKKEVRKVTLTVYTILSKYIGDHIKAHYTLLCSGGRTTTSTRGTACSATPRM